MSIVKNTRERLMDHLADLEHCLDMPQVPGELQSWLSNVERAITEAETAYQSYLVTEHAAQLEEIASEDIELMARVQEIRADDACNLARLAQIKSAIVHLDHLVDGIGPDEKRADKGLQIVIRKGLEFVVEARRIDTVTETWLSEAFDRDRGPVD